MSEQLQTVPDFDVSMDAEIVEEEVSLTTVKEDVGAPDKEQKLKQESFGAIDVNDFTDFSTLDNVVDSGEYLFSVERERLKFAVSVVKLTVAHTGMVRITLFEDKLRLASFNQSAFSEYFIPTLVPIKEVEKGKEPALSFDVVILDKIARTFPEGTIEFKYNAEKMLLTIVSGQTTLELSTYPSSEFVDYHKNLSDPEYVSAIDPSVFHDAISYNMMFIEKGESSAATSYSVTNFKENQSIGGHSASVGHYKHASFNGVDFSLRNDSLKIIQPVLQRLNASNTHLWKSSNFLIFRDENVYLGVECPMEEFPDTTHLLNLKQIDKVLVSRSKIASALTKLKVVSISSDLLVRLVVTGSGDASKLRLETQDQAGKVSFDQVDCVRLTDNSDVIDLSVKITMLSKIVNHFSTSNVEIAIPETKTAVLVYDEPVDGTSCVSIFTAISADPEER